MQAIREEISMIFLTDFFNAAGILPYHIRCNAPNEKYIVFFVFRNRAPLLAKLAVCNVVFPDFCSIDRSPVLTHHHLLLFTAGRCFASARSKNTIAPVVHLHRCVAV